MSRIGIKPIPVPGTVQVDISKDNDVKVKGPKGELSQKLTHKLQLVQEDGRYASERGPGKQGPSWPYTQFAE